MPLPAPGKSSIPRGVIHIERSRFLCSERLHERLRFTNFSDHNARVPLKISFAADFAREMHVHRPQLPPGIESLTLKGVRVNDARVDLEFHRIGSEVVAAPASTSKAACGCSLACGDFTRPKGTLEHLPRGLRLDVVPSPAQRLGCQCYRRQGYRLSS